MIVELLPKIKLKQYIFHLQTVTSAVRQRAKLITYLFCFEYNYLFFMQRIYMGSVPPHTAMQSLSPVTLINRCDYRRSTQDGAANQRVIYRYSCASQCSHVLVDLQVSSSTEAGVRGRAGAVVRSRAVEVARADIVPATIPRRRLVGGSATVVCSTRRRARCCLA